MQENSKYAVGLDIGTTVIRCVVGHIDSVNGTPTIVGIGKVPNKGMRKGVVVNLNGPSDAIDQALGDAERMSGYQVDAATVSINGQHILSTKADGMIAVGGVDHAINSEDLARVEEVATSGKIPANREIIEVVPHSYKLDGQDNIKDPLGMTGTRLEISSNIVSVLVPHLDNLEKSTEAAKVHPNAIVPSVLASSRAVLSESQLENGVAVIDFGGSTTSVAVFEEGDLQYIGVVPIGGVNITNDLAIGLKITPEIAEGIKLEHAVAIPREQKSGVSIKHDDEVLTFDTAEIDDIVEARLEEIFEGIQKELKKAGRAGKLPNGILLTGGGANLKQIAEYTKQSLGLAAKTIKASGYAGVSEEAETFEFSCAVGLMLIDSERGFAQSKKHSKKAGGSGFNSKGKLKKAGGALQRFLGKFKT
jgi:cell division protein FtsA